MSDRILFQCPHCRGGKSGRHPNTATMNPQRTRWHCLHCGEFGAVNEDGTIQVNFPDTGDPWADARRMAEMRRPVEDILNWLRGEVEPDGHVSGTG